MKLIHSPRVTGQVIYEPLGRLVPEEVDFDCAEKIITFKAESKSRGKKTGRAYIVEIDLLSTEVGCGCESLSRNRQGEDDRVGFREAALMPYRFDASASPLEAIAKSLGVRMLPSIARAPRHLCPHARRARQWLQRHGHWDYFVMRHDALADKFSELRDVRKSA